MDMDMDTTEEDADQVCNHGVWVLRRTVQ